MRASTWALLIVLAALVIHCAWLIAVPLTVVVTAAGQPLLLAVAALLILAFKARRRLA